MRPFTPPNQQTETRTHEEQMEALNKALEQTEAHLARLRGMGVQFEEQKAA